MKENVNIKKGHELDLLTGTHLHLMGFAKKIAMFMI